MRPLNTISKVRQHSMPTDGMVQETDDNDSLVVNPSKYTTPVIKIMCYFLVWFGDLQQQLKGFQ